MFKTAKYETGLQIIGYIGEVPKNLVIPAEIDGKLVLRIGRYAFENSQIQQLTIPKGCEIGNYAFENNQIQQLTIPEGCQIGHFAFGNNQIQQLTIPEGCQIGYFAFEYNPLHKSSVTS